MAHFFCDCVSDHQILLIGEEARHISKSLRMKIGEGLTVSTSDGFDHKCHIESISPEEVLLSVDESYPNQTEPQVKVTLFQAVPKSDKMDFIVQKAVELGAVRIVPMMTRRCVSRPDDKSAGKKVERWNKIAKEAAKQSGRGIIPEVHSIVSWNEALKMASEADLGICFYEGGGEKIQNLLGVRPHTIAVFIGSEGGFEEQEVQQAESIGIRRGTLGKRILRCETAPIAALAVLMNLTDD